MVQQTRQPCTNCSDAVVGAVVVTVMVIVLGLLAIWFSHTVGYHDGRNDGYPAGYSDGEAFCKKIQP
jgi:hypothetical protein